MSREYWTKEKIKKQILEIVENTGIDHMPTGSEVNKYFGNYKLSNAISKRKMWYPLAKELGLKIKDSETTKGKTYEQITFEKLICMGYEAERMPQNFPYDILVENSLKIDVKVSCLYKGKSGNFYTFNLEKPYSTCDIYILYCKNDFKDDEVIILPSKYVSNNTQISIGELKSKYYEFKNKWEYIDEYVKFYKEI